MIVVESYSIFIVDVIVSPQLHPVYVISLVLLNIGKRCIYQQKTCDNLKTNFPSVSPHKSFLQSLKIEYGGILNLWGWGSCVLQRHYCHSVTLFCKRTSKYVCEESNITELSKGRKSGTARVEFQNRQFEKPNY